MSRISAPWTSAAVLSAVVVGFAVLGVGWAHAQDEERFIDLAVELEFWGNEDGRRGDHNSRTHLYASNRGNQAAYGVEVEFEQVEHSTSAIPIRLQLVQDLPTGTVDPPPAMVTGTMPSNRFKWTIPILPPHTQYRLVIDRTSTATRSTRVFAYSATIRSGTSYEPPERRHNNSARAWETWHTSGRAYAAQPDYWVQVSVDDRHPQPGDTVNFTVTAEMENVTSALYADACINVWLTSGLSAGAATFEPSTITDLAYNTGASRQCGGTGEATGVYEIGGPRNPPFASVSMVLPVTVDSNATVGEQCLTAEIFATPPIGAGGVLLGTSLDDPSDNRLVYCLGYPPLEPFDGGEVRTWTIYACKDGVAANMCDIAEEVDVRVLATFEEDAGHVGHGHGQSGDYLVLDNATALIHVKDVPGRVFDANSGSVTDGNTVSWQTATDEAPDFTGTREGVTPGLYRAPVNDYINNWTHYHPTFRASGIDGGDPPGDVSIRSAISGGAFWALTSENFWTSKRASAFNLSSTSTTVTKLMIEVDDLGTYVVDFDVDVKHATIDDDTDGESDVFSGTGRTIFHVGPIAELGVSDNGASPHAGADQVAFTVVGVNNRDESAESGKIVVELSAGTTGLATFPANTGVFDGSAGPPTWTWDIHDLELADRRASKGHPEGVAVSLIVGGVSAGETATAKIFYDPYTVCIGGDGANLDHDGEAACTDGGGDWHEGTVFDYLDSNNVATLVARSGLVGSAPDTAPELVQAIATGPRANMVTWSAPESADHGPVRSWDIEYNDDEGVRWIPLVYRYNGINDYRYFLDTNIPTGSLRYYRVRARYSERVGEWTEQSVPGAAGATGAAEAGDPGVTISRDALTLREGGSASYSVRLDARPAGNVVIDLSNSNPDVRLSRDQLTFTPSNWSRAQTVSVAAVDDGDTVDDTDVITHVIDQALTSEDYAYFALPAVTVSVTDNDTTPRFTVGGSSRTEIFVDEGGSTEYQLALGTRPTEDVRVSLSFPSGIIEVSPRNLTFTPENYNTPQTITVTGLQDDDAVDNDLGFICHSFSGEYAESECLGVVVRDDDRAGVGGEVELAISRGYCPGTWPQELSGSRVEVMGYPEEAGGCFYSLRLNAAPTGNVTVRVTTTNSSKVELDTTISHYLGEETPGRLTFTPENWRDAQEIGFWPVHDPDAANNNDFSIRHSVSGGGFNNVVIPEIKVNVVDADRDQIGFRVDGPHGGVQVEEGGSCSWNEDRDHAAFYMFPMTQPVSTVTVSMSSDNTDVTLSPSRLSFTSSNWDRGAFEGYPGKRVMVCAREDADEDDDTAEITFTVTSSDADYNGIPLTPVPVRVTDDDKEQ